MEIGIAPFGERSVEFFEYPRLPVVEGAVADGLNDVVQFFIPGQPFGGPVGVLAAHPLEVLGPMAEDEDIVRTDRLGDLDVGPVPGADGQGSVEGQLHVAGAAGLLAGRGDLLGQVGGRDDDLGQRNAVVGQEGHAQAPGDIGIPAEDPPQRVDELDDELGPQIARGRLGPEDEGPGHDVPGGIVLDPMIKGDDMQGVQELAFVFVQALDLDVEDRTGIHHAAQLIGDEGGQNPFVGVFDGQEAVPESGVLGQGFETPQLVQVADPAVADGLADERRQPGIAGQEPAPGRNAVGLVAEALREHFREIGHHRAL